MSAELNSKFLKISFHDSKTGAELSDGITTKTDLKTVRDAVSSAVVVAGFKNCMKLGGTAAVIATATLVAAKSLAARWSWLKTTNVEEENVLKMAIPPARKETFEKILESEQLKRAVQENFADLKSNLEQVIKTEVYDQVGSQILELIQDIRVSSVCESRTTGGIQNNLVAMNIVEGGERDVTERNVNKLVAVDGKGKGMVAMGYVGKSGKIKGTVTGGSYAVISGDKEFVKEATAAQAELNDKKVLITVRFPEDHSPKFEQSFQPTDKIFDIRSALKEEREKLYFLVREEKPGELLPNSLRVVDIKEDLYGYENEETVHKHSSPLVPATVQALPSAVNTPVAHLPVNVLLAANVVGATSPISVPATAQSNIEQPTSDIEIVEVKPSDEVTFREHLTKDTIYHIKREHQKGRVLIINKEFRGQEGKERTGSDVDFKNMKELWQKLGFEVVSSNNQPAQEMLRSCKNFARKTNNTSALVVIVMSHGGMNKHGKEFFYGEDNKQILLEDIILKFTTSKCPHLKGVPRVFMLQACRGDKNDVQPDGPKHAVIERLPMENDMLLTYPTKRGFVALRNVESGSWMINAVTNIFMEHAHDTHILDMLTMVNDAVGKKVAPESGLVQVSNQENYLRKQLFLFPGWPQ